MRPFRLLIAAALTVPLFTTPAHAAYSPPGGYAPQGGRWEANGTGPTYHEGMRATRPTARAIAEYQSVLGVPQTRRFDRPTRDAVLRHQRARRWLRNTGRIDAPTSRSLLAPIIVNAARRHGVSARLLCGHLWAESRLDPGAVGPGGIDFGIGQIVPRYRPGTDPWNVRAAIDRMARDDASAMRRYDTWGQVAWWSPQEARVAAAGHASREAWAYRKRIAAAPCGGF